MLIFVFINAISSFRYDTNKNIVSEQGKEWFTELSKNQMKGLWVLEYGCSI